MKIINMIVAYDINKYNLFEKISTYKSDNTEFIFKTAKRVLRDKEEMLKESSDYVAPFLEAKKNGEKTLKTNWGNFNVNDVILGSKDNIEEMKSKISAIKDFMKLGWEVFEIAIDIESDKKILKLICEAVEKDIATTIDDIEE